MSDGTHELRNIGHKLEVLIALQTRTNLLLEVIAKQEIIMSKEIDDLKAAVEAETTVNQSAITLLTNLSAQIAAVAGDKDATEALANTVKANADALGAAVTANTPAATPPADAGSGASS